MRVCVCLHLYYWEMIPEIKQYLKNLPEYDLYITTPEDNRKRENEILAEFEHARVIYTENEGFDVYPFICFLREVDLRQYDVVVKLHTKKDIPIVYSLNGFDLSNHLWRYYLLDGILGDKKRTDKILKEFATDKKLGMVGSAELIIRDDDIDKDIDMNKVQQTMHEIGLSIHKREFIAGSIFIIRAELLEKLKERNYSVEEFPPYLPRDWNGLPYCLERCFGCMISAQGYKLKGVYASSTIQNRKLYIMKRVQAHFPKMYSKMKRFKEHIKK